MSKSISVGATEAFMQIAAVMKKPEANAPGLRAV
jgi:hypothetical protein